MPLMTSDRVSSGIAAVDAYLADGYENVVGMSGRFAAALTCGLMRIQTKAGVTGEVAEIGAFEGRFFIALTKALAAGEQALGMDLFTWPDPQVIDRFRENCARHGLDASAFSAWQCDSGKLTG